ncbi:MAG: response regulator transcription factor [Hyphomicrobiaceae bacterium]
MITATTTPLRRPGDRTAHRLIVVDDDPVFCRTLRRAMRRRGFETLVAHTLDEARQLLAELPFDYATIDLRIGTENGLDLLELVGREHPHMRCVILTGYGNVATAVSATKLGAYDYLSKPADAAVIEQSLRGTLKPLRSDQTFPRPEVQEFRYLLAMYEQHGRNMSETARAASMHRRTLQRILRRYGVGPSEQVPPEARNERPHLRRLYRVWSSLLDGSGSDRAQGA